MGAPTRYLFAGLLFSVLDRLVALTDEDGAALLVFLPGAAEGNGIIGHVCGDDAAGGDIGAIADRHRCDERRVGADEGIRADARDVLVDAVVVAGDGARADIGVRTDEGVATQSVSRSRWRTR